MFIQCRSIALLCRRYRSGVAVGEVRAPHREAVAAAQLCVASSESAQRPRVAQACQTLRGETSRCAYRPDSHHKLSIVLQIQGESKVWIHPELRF